MALKGKKKNILNAAVEIARKEGWENVSVRKVSKSIGYSTIKVYSDFGSKENLFAAIQKEGFVLLRRKYEAAISTEKTAIDTLKLLAMEHVRFSDEHPTYYELMFTYKFRECVAETTKAKRATGALIAKVISSMNPKDGRLAFLQFFTLLSGFVQVHKEFGREDVHPSEQIMEGFVENFVHGIL
ncbi:MAG: TetR/AcrR family transcriptional regulator [Bacteroidota bacterium]